MSYPHIYRNDFFDSIEAGARRSAQVFIPILINALPLRSVLDVGCGRGVWLEAWRSAGIEDVLGLDGDYVDTTTLLIPEPAFSAVNLANGFRLDRRFDMVQCLEVAEHLSPAAADPLVESLVAHGDLILFSAAVPGQGGQNHLNERPLSYWRAKFLEHGYLAFDFVRPAVIRDQRVEPWYRYNTILYVAKDATSNLPASIRAAQVPANRQILDRSPLGRRLKRAMRRYLPTAATERLAKTRRSLKGLLRN